MAKAETKKEKTVVEDSIPEKRKKSKGKDKKEPNFLDTISGIGPTTRKRLEEAGFGSKETIALATRSQLSDISGIAEKTA